jgi:hypothetical protein
VAISLSTISSVFSPSAAGRSGGQSFLNSLGGSDPITDQTLAIGHALSDAIGNSQINRTQGTSSLAANAAIKRIHAAIVAKQKAALATKAVLSALTQSPTAKNKVNKIA